MKKFISLLLSFCILVLQVGCYSARPITMEKASKKMEWNNSLVLHTPGKVYNVHNYRFKDDILTGQLKKYTMPWRRTIHVYTQKEFSMEPSRPSGPSITLERSDIEKITFQKQTKITLLLIVGVIIFTITMLPINPGSEGGWFEKY